MEDNKLYAWIWGCVAIVAVVGIASITYYNLNSPSTLEIRNEYSMKKLEFQQNMVSKYGVSPAVLECLERNWGDVAVYQICKEVLGNHKLTKEQAARLVEKTRELNR